MQQEIKQTQGDSIHSGYETALCRAFEELRLKRKTERKNEKIISSLLQVKYDLERKIEEERRNFETEKNALEAQLENYRKELKEKDHAAECNVKKQQVFSTMFEKEVAALREELKAMHMDYLNLEKKCREFETSSKLYQNMKDAALKRIDEVQQTQSYIESQVGLLKNAEDKLKETVSRVYALAEERHFANKHLLDVMIIMGQRIRFLSEELIKSESKLKYIAVTSALPSQNDSKTSAISTNNKPVQSPWIITLNKEVNNRHQKIVDILSDIHKVHLEFTEIEKRKVDSNDTMREVKMTESCPLESSKLCEDEMDIEKSEH